MQLFFNKMRLFHAKIDLLQKSVFYVRVRNLNSTYKRAILTSMKARINAYFIGL